MDREPYIATVGLVATFVALVLGYHVGHRTGFLVGVSATRCLLRCGLANDCPVGLTASERDQPFLARGCKFWATEEARTMQHTVFDEVD